MLFLASCPDSGADLMPILRLAKHGIIPVIQIAIIAALVVLLIIDFGKAVMAGKEDEIKSAQKMAIKRVVYALVVFLVPLIINVAIGLLANAKDDNGKVIGEKAEVESYWQCWQDA